MIIGNDILVKVDCFNKISLSKSKGFEDSAVETSHFNGRPNLCFK